LHELLPISLDMAVKKRVGVYNFCNPGIISHNEILQLYKQIVDPSFTWRNFSLEEQSKVIKAGRSNNKLDVGKLLAEYPDVPEVHVAVANALARGKFESTYRAHSEKTATN
jgi:3,5-epimerase/4-reductase